MNGEQRESHSAGARSLVVIRALTVLVVVLIGEWTRLPAGIHVDHPGFEIACGVALAWAVTMGWLTIRRSDDRPPLRVLGVVDLCLLCALTYESGGTVSQARKAFFLVPVVVAMLYGPRTTAIWSGVATGAFLAITLPDTSQYGSGGVAGVISQATYIALVGAAAVLLSRLLAHERERVLRLASSRQELLAWTLSAEEDLRQQLAQRLHDGPTQNVLAAIRMLPRVARGEPGRREQIELALRETVGDLRGAIFDLHPNTLAEQGLPGAIRLAATRAVEAAGVKLVTDLEPLSEPEHDDLLFACARELVANAVRHADASHVEVRLNMREGYAMLTVVDDGVGLKELPACQPGHLGLATMSERVAARRGRLRLLPRSTGCGVEIAIPVRCSTSNGHPVSKK